MKISILITTYNLEKYIANTLDSVINQETSCEYEILVGDDGSSDGTVNIIEEYINNNPGRIILYKMPREEGVNYNRVERSAANRINLLSHAKGEYVSFLDGDDFYISNKRLEIMSAELDKNKDAIMCMHNLYMHYDSNDTGVIYSESNRLCRATKKHIWDIKDYWPLVFVQANGLMFRNIYKDEGRREELLNNAGLLNNFDDNNITFWLFKYGKMIYLPECLGAYRQVSGSSWNGIDELKKHASNILGFAVERGYNKVEESFARHYVNVKYLYEHQDEITREVCEPFYSTAKKYNLEDALKIYEGRIEINEFRQLLKKCKKLYTRAKLIRIINKKLGRY